jgi:hypothetical protein
MSAQVKREIPPRGKQFFAPRTADMGAEPYPQRLRSHQTQLSLTKGCTIEIFIVADWREIADDFIYSAIQKRQMAGAIQNASRCSRGIQ